MLNQECVGVVLLVLCWVLGAQYLVARVHSTGRAALSEHRGFRALGHAGLRRSPSSVPWCLFSRKWDS